MASHTVSDLICGKGDYQLLNIGLYGSAKSSKGKTYLPIGTVPASPSSTQSDWGQANAASPDYIKNKPTIPTATSQLANDSNFVQTTNGKIPLRLLPITTASGAITSTAQLTNGEVFDAITFPVPAGAVAGGTVNYCVQVHNSTDMQLTCGQSTFTCVNQGGTAVIGSASSGLQSQTLTSGTHLVGVNVHPGSGICSWKIRSTSSLDSITSTQLTIDVRPLISTTFALN
jgi:hypothetical protein